MRGNATERVATSCIIAKAVFLQHHNIITESFSHCKLFRHFFQKNYLPNER
ncbi:hypothetical protein HMPREF1240_0474 [Streptococcus pyogenes GA03455]|nr:hypothetical protein HMPREF1240_0474 [Streptococcus pyogenes GA03455]